MNSEGDLIMNHIKTLVGCKIGVIIIIILLREMAVNSVEPEQEGTQWLVSHLGPLWRQ